MNPEYVQSKMMELFGSREGHLAWQLITLSEFGQPCDVTFYNRKPIFDCFGALSLLRARFRLHLRESSKQFVRLNRKNFCIAGHQLPQIAAIIGRRKAFHSTKKQLVVFA